MAILIDTNALLAYTFANDINHKTALTFFRALKNEVRIVPIPILSELFYLSTVRMNYKKAVEIFAVTSKAFQIEPITVSDMIRMQEIMTQYQTAEFDFADVSIMALAERLQITRICTFDRRDFSIFRPTHCSHYELLP